MQKYCKNITELVGDTPLMQVCNLEKKLQLSSKIYVKLEYLNPSGSVKDRAVLGMLEAARKDGKLKDGGTIIEPTSGNTGIALAALGKAMGYKVIIVMPESMSLERRQIIRAQGAELVLTAAASGMSGAIKEAEKLRAQIPGSIILGQFENPANADAHRATTGPEIYSETDGKIDIFVAGVGTGGTITGVGEYLKSLNPDIKIVAVEPADSPVLSGGKAGPHKIQGIGAGFVPEILNRSIIDEIYRVTTEEATWAARLLADTEGILSGFSSGAALWVAIEEAKKYRDEIIVALLPDSGAKYLSTDLFAAEI